MANALQIRTHVDAAVAAMEVGNWQGAKTRLMQAKAILSTLPDMTKGGDGVQYDRSSIDSLINQCDQEMAAASVASSGLRQSRFRFRETR